MGIPKILKTLSVKNLISKAGSVVSPFAGNLAFATASA